jgi:predicted neuraminidase
MFRIALIAAVVAGALAAGELRVERVFGPETATGRYKHPASITELENGDLMLVYYGGEGEYAVDTGVFGSKRSKATGKWSAPKMIAHDPFRSVGNGVIWQAPDGLVWLFYVVRWGATWSTSRIQAKVSKDAGETWSDSYVVSEKEGMMVRGAPIVLDTGEYYLPVYHETGNDTEIVGADTTSRFLRWNPKEKLWKEEPGAIRSRSGNLQPAVVQLDSKRLVAYCRRGGGYGPVKDGYIVKAESNDGGRTWSEGVDTQFPNPNSAIELLKLKSGSVLLVYNDSMSARTPLRVALSADGTKTWPWQRNIAGGKNSFAYPFAIQGRDGRIHVIFTSDSRTVVQHAVLDEEWVKMGTR